MALAGGKVYLRAGRVRNTGAATVNPSFSLSHAFQSRFAGQYARFHARGARPVDAARCIRELILRRSGARPAPGALGTDRHHARLSRQNSTPRRRGVWDHPAGGYFAHARSHSTTWARCLACSDPNLRYRCTPTSWSCSTLPAAPPTRRPTPPWAGARCRDCRSFIPKNRLTPAGRCTHCRPTVACPACPAGCTRRAIRSGTCIFSGKTTGC